MIAACAFDGCPRQAACRGYCEAHYHQWIRGSKMHPVKDRKHPIGSQQPWLEAHAAFAGDECLIWPFHRYHDGRGVVSFNGKQRQAHRVMCELVNGPPPTDKHEAAHSCGKGHLGCVNPRHLSWKTSKENKEDQLRHGTRVWGEKHPCAKLTAQQVLAIRAAAKSKSKSAVAREFGLNPAHVDKLVARTIWRHL